MCSRVWFMLDRWEVLSQHCRISSAAQAWIQGTNFPNIRASVFKLIPKLQRPPWLETKFTQNLVRILTRPLDPPPPSFGKTSSSYQGFFRAGPPPSPSDLVLAWSWLASHVLLEPSFYLYSTVLWYIHPWSVIRNKHFVKGTQDFQFWLQFVCAIHIRSEACSSEKQRKSKIIYANPTDRWKWMKIHQNRWESRRSDEEQCTSMKIYEINEKS